MDVGKKRVTIAVSVALQDAGEATRAVELMRGVKDNAPAGYALRAVFFSHGSKFDSLVEAGGFELLRVDPRLEGEGYLSDLKPTATNFVGSRKMGAAMIRGELKALQALKPDLLVHGFWPFVSIARRLMPSPLPTVRFLPLPLDPAAFAQHLLTDIPDQTVPLALLPTPIRRWIARGIPAEFLENLPIYRQKNLAGAALDCGWRAQPFKNLFEMLEADLTLINDHAGFYRGMRLPEDFIITGPLYASPRPGDAVDPEISRLFRRERTDQVNVFCSMGSSATKRFLIEAAWALRELPDRYHSVILSPRAVCPVEEIRAITEGKPNLYVTDRFVPAALVCALSDITVSHGGQGTVQTALASSTPIVGFAMQPEQQINLDHAVLQGAAVRIPKFRWTRVNVREAVEHVAANDTCRENAARLGRAMALEDGRKAAAEAIWAFIRQRLAL
jgi:hypothetical protein